MMTRTQAKLSTFTSHNSSQLTNRIMSPMRSRSVTIVIPCMDEEGNLERLFEYIDLAFKQLGYTLPVLVINDGSTDNTLNILNKLCQRYDFLSVISHPQNRGVAEVWNTALNHVKTDWILWGQADLESDPRVDIPALIDAWKPGVDAIAGWRQGRGDGKSGASSIANRACCWAFGLKIHDMNWTKLVRRDIVSRLPVTLITHRFLLAVLAGQGYNVIETPTPWFPRFSGVSKFGRKRLLTSARDFLRVLGWFYVAQPMNAVFYYMSAFIEAAQVGFSAASHNFQVNTSPDYIAAYKEKSFRDSPLRTSSSVANIAYYRRLALAKVAA
ncbi:MAG: glycosyltransferase family 2 protein [Leptolyngbya sp. SIO1E4]|nr:glycosyltransferase family 2 protein [Leptolyngbya sp. SIO1E4]